MVKKMTRKNKKQKKEQKNIFDEFRNGIDEALDILHNPSDY